MLESLALACIAFPILAALLVLMLRVSAIRGLLVVATGAVLAVASVLLAKNGAFTLTADTMFGLKVDSLILVLDFALLTVIFLLGLWYQLIDLKLESQLLYYSTVPEYYEDQQLT